MRSVRMLLATVGLLGLAVGVSACGVAQANASGVWVQVSPSSITAGFSIAVRASCGDNSNSATVSSKAFGSVTLEPLSSLLQAEVLVPQSTPEGGYNVTLSCRTGATASTTLWVINKSGARPAGPHTGGGFLATHPDSGRTGGLLGPVLWLSGGTAALTAAAMSRVVSTRRRRRTTSR